MADTSLTPDLFMQQQGSPLTPDSFMANNGAPGDAVERGSSSVSTPTEFIKTLRDHLWPSAVGVVKQTVDAYRNMGPRLDTVSLGSHDPRIAPDAPFYGYKKALLDLEDTAKSIYDKVTHPASTVANDPVGVAADFGKLVSSIRIARGMVEGKPATEIHPVDKALDAVGNVADTPAGRGVTAAVRETTNLPIAKSIKVGARAYRQARTQQAIDELPTIENPLNGGAPPVAAPNTPPAPGPSPIITPPPADPSGVIPGWKPTILEGGEQPAAPENSASAAPAQSVPASLTLNDVAKQVFKQDFDSLGKAGKEFVQQALDKYNRAAAPAPPPAAPAAAPVTQPAVTDPALPLGGGGPLQPPMAAAAPVAPAELPASSEPPASFLDQESTGLGPAPQIAVNRAAKAQRFINRLGGTQNLPRTQAEWEKLAADIGEKVPSAETQAQITLGLNKRMRGGVEKPGNLPTPKPTEIPNWVKNAKDPVKALKAAELLKQAIQ